MQPGIVLDELQKAAAEHGLLFGADPSTHSRCTLGGMIGNNACGSHSARLGPHRGQRRGTRSGHLPRHGGPARRDDPGRDRRGRRRGRRPRRARSPPCTVSPSAIWRRCAPSWGSSHGRCRAMRWNICCRSGASTSPKPSSAARAHWPSSSRRPSASWRRRPRGPWSSSGSRTPVPRPTRSPRCSSTQLLALEGLDHALTDIVTRPATRAAIDSLPAAQAWLFAELGGTGGRAAPAGRGAGGDRAPGRGLHRQRGHHRSRTGPWPVADPRGRSGPGHQDARRFRSLARMGGRGRTARPTRLLSAQVHRSAAPP